MNQQVLNKEAVEAATKIALKSGEDDLFLITPLGAVKLERGMYGGWLLKPPSVIDADYGIWCFASQRKEADNEAGVRSVRERVARIANILGVRSEPQVALIEKWFKVVKVVKVEDREEYAVYDFEPTKEGVTAVLAYVHHHMWRSRRGRCHGEICRMLEKFKLLLKAEFNEEAEVGEAGVYVPYDVHQLSAVVAKLMSTEAAAERRPSCKRQESWKYGSKG
jgi:hypothetical protein